jgi:hypothetical protein
LSIFLLKSKPGVVVWFSGKGLPGVNQALGLIANTKIKIKINEQIKLGLSIHQVVMHQEKVFL